jgi:hypothetical protein
MYDCCILYAILHAAVLIMLRANTDWKVHAICPTAGYHAAVLTMLRE